jgi:tetratricopeptide (TPR) repeat protein
MSIADTSFESACDAYRAADYRYASMLFRQAAEQAREHLDETLWYSAMVWYAESLYQLDDLRGAFDAILTARTMEPPCSEFENWLCRKLQFKIRLAWEPLITELQVTLAVLATFQADGSVPAHDLHVCRGELAFARGDYRAALVDFERADIALDKEKGSAKCGFAYFAARCCILSGQFEAANDWLAAIDDKREREKGFGRTISYLQACGNAELARAMRASQPELMQRLRELDDVCDGGEDSSLRNRLFVERMWIGLLDRIMGDPGREVHPSRKACRDLIMRSLDRHVLFEQALLLLDYRLACVRFVAGLDLVDYGIGRVPAMATVPNEERAEGFRRVRRAVAALRRAQERAEILDGMLDCSWRGEAVAIRRRGVEEVIRVFTQPSP